MASASFMQTNTILTINMKTEKLSHGLLFDITQFYGIKCYESQMEINDWMHEMCGLFLSDELNIFNLNEIHFQLAFSSVCAIFASISFILFSQKGKKKHKNCIKEMYFTEFCITDMIKARNEQWTCELRITIGIWKKK